MRLFGLTVLTMIAFAANSVLNRMGLAQAGLDPVLFGTVRLMAGAAMLALLSFILRGGVPLGGRGRLIGVLSLSLYVFGFSMAYTALDAGIGALVLFGMVQVTMFAGALWLGERVPAIRWAGALVAFAGLVWLLWPGGGVTLPFIQAGMMVLAGIGWGIYSLNGRGAGDALQATAANFVLAVPIALILLLAKGMGGANMAGLLLAVLSGAVTSGLGYALWYAILPMLGATRAAVAQLTVPVIAIAGGVLFLGEVPSLAFLMATTVVLAGVALSSLAR
ncbi:DMT family transporter [Thalassovita mangrovi]|uniref:EamA family transporter n=1 Tax=Thalassovita mangrovi TaxID=2692236 RepID=A0A6L8LFV8_9RHOB|nr:DMT family transporter [Thalassovita mangrovi]MYM54957.1 EamA family transporter [Thalassovita mangrovi]